MTDDFIGKPLRASELFNKIERHLKLQYIEEPSPDEPTPDESVVVVPSELVSEVVRRLREAVEVGNITKLNELANELIERGPETEACGNQIMRLGKAFDFDGLLALADSLQSS